MNDFISALQKPEYVHILLNPLPVYATALGALALVVALLARSRGGQGIALMIIVIGCLAVWPVSQSGERAEHDISRLADDIGERWLHEHEERAEDGAWVFYVTAALAVAALVSQWKFPKIGAWFVGLALVGALACVGAGAWIGQAGGRIRHPEFRAGPPPESSHEH